MPDEFICFGHQVLRCARSSEVIQKPNLNHGIDNRFVVVGIARDAAVQHWSECRLNLPGTPELRNCGVLINAMESAGTMNCRMNFLQYFGKCL